MLTSLAVTKTSSYWSVLLMLPALLSSFIFWFDVWMTGFSQCCRRNCLWRFTSLQNNLLDLDHWHFANSPPMPKSVCDLGKKKGNAEKETKGRLYRDLGKNVSWIIYRIKVTYLFEMGGNLLILLEKLFFDSFAFSETTCQT